MQDVDILKEYTAVVSSYQELVNNLNKELSESVAGLSERVNDSCSSVRERLTELENLEKRFDNLHNDHHECWQSACNPKQLEPRILQLELAQTNLISEVKAENSRNWKIFAGVIIAWNALWCGGYGYMLNMLMKEVF